MPCAVILTALSIEYQAVRIHLSDLREETYSQGNVYERGVFTANGEIWDVGIVEIGMGNPGVAFEAERAIAYFKPSYIFFVGVAGGLKDVKVGDVVVSTKIYGYESGKADVTFKPRPEIGLPAYSLEQRARAEARKSDWLSRLSTVPKILPTVRLAPIAAGEKVITSKQSEIFHFLRSHYEDAIAVEMEGLGFLEAVRANKQVDAIVIRGISDLIEGKGASDKAGNQEIASRHASAFAFEMLTKLPTVASGKTAGDTMVGRQSDTDKMLQNNFGNAKGNQAVAKDGGVVYMGEIHFHGDAQPKGAATSVSKQNQAPQTLTSPKPGEIEVFFSYSHKDEALRDQLETHLSTLKRKGVIKAWHDRQIGAGKEWAGEIDQKLETAHIILLLVSADFINSDYCMDRELTRSMQRHEAGEARVIPVILRPVDWEGILFSKLQALPKDGKPVTSWKDTDEAFLNIAKGLQSVVEEIVRGFT